MNILIPRPFDFLASNERAPGLLRGEDSQGGGWLVAQTGLHLVKGFTLSS